MNIDITCIGDKYKSYISINEYDKSENDNSLKCCYCGIDILPGMSYYIEDDTNIVSHPECIRILK